MTWWLAVAAAAPVRYELRADPSWLYVLVTYDREKWAAVAVHDHVVRASAFEGTVLWDPADPAACDIRIAFPVTSLVVDPPGGREREGLDPSGAVSDDDKRSIVKNMLSSMNLDAARFGAISYRSVSCAPRADGRVDVTGELSIRGVSKQVTTPMTVTAAAETFAASGVLSVTHADFGMKPFTIGGFAAAFAPRNAEALKIVVDVVGSAAPDP